MLALPFDPPHSSESHADNRNGLWTTPCIPRQPNAVLREEVVKYHRLANLPTYAMFAEQFCIATQWRSALAGHTWPNRLYSLSGSSNGALNNPHGAFDFYDLPTICDVLSAQGVSWGYYKQDVAFLELFRPWTFDNTRIHQYVDFESSITNGTLPTVSWVEPNILDFGSIRASDDHPPLPVTAGQRFVGTVYNALCRLRTPNWLLVVCYDEHGGFYESVGPVDAPDDFSACRSTGFRVPAFFVSPLVKARSTYSAPLDHSSVIRTILDAYCEPEPIFERNRRVAGARSFLDLIAPGATARPSAQIPVLAEPEVPENVEESVAVTSPEWQAFKERRAQREAASTTPESAPVSESRPPAVLEAIYIVAVSEAARNALADELIGAWDVHPAFDDPRSLSIEPRVPITIDEAWNAVHELRGRRDVVVVDPLWETELEWPHDEPELESAAAADPTWPIAMVRAREAWLLPSPEGESHGAGIVVGHIDTGYTVHSELEHGALLIEYGYNFLEDNGDAKDPLVSGVGRFPGHGTATASMLASREAGEIAGTAPAATLIPYRVSRSVVHFSMKRMVAAIRRAVAYRCHLISISAGGLWSAALRRAVREAHDAGVIVIAAAGNYAPFVVWPAAYPEVIACAACDVHQAAWRWSSRGDAVDITAPGASLVVAKAGGGTYASSGTSYATAIVAGAVASWLAFHGRDRLAAMYGEHNLTRVVRDLLRRTARPLDGDAGGMGPGILDMQALLAEPLPDVLGYPRFREERVDAPVVESLAEVRELAAPIAPDVIADLPLDRRQTLADELLFHRALDLVGPRTEALESSSRIPANASAALIAALR
jgi:hypothetical protein